MMYRSEGIPAEEIDQEKPMRNVTERIGARVEAATAALRESEVPTTTEPLEGETPAQTPAADPIKEPPASDSTERKQAEAPKELF